MTNKIVRLDRAQVDRAVLSYYQSRVGACAHYCATALKLERAEVSKSLQRLKRRGLVIAEGFYWRVKP